MWMSHLRAFTRVTSRVRRAISDMHMTRKPTPKSRHFPTHFPRKTQSRDPVSPDLTSVCEFIVRLSPDIASSISNPRASRRSSLVSAHIAQMQLACNTCVRTAARCTVNEKNLRNTTLTRAFENQLTPSCCFGIGYV